MEATRRELAAGHRYRRVRALASAVAAVLLVVAGCTVGQPDHVPAARTAPGSTSTGAAPQTPGGPATPGGNPGGPATPGGNPGGPATPGGNLPAPETPTDQPPAAGRPLAVPPLPDPGPAPTRRFSVAVRTVPLSRGPDRPLPTTVWYPAARPGGSGAPPADGRFPLVLFSHGLSGRPGRYADLLSAWAAAGFVVAAPAYPHTRAGAPRFDRGDIVAQPADAAYVIEQLRQLDRTAGDPLAGRIDGDRVAAVGHSAGGYTTTGLFTAGHDPRLRAAVVLAGWLAPGAFAGPPATLLFIHGGSDQVVPVATGRAAYAQVPWPKHFLVLQHRWHSDYLLAGRPGFRLVRTTVLDFLRWTLYGDDAAHRRLPAGSYPTHADHLATTG